MAYNVKFLKGVASAYAALTAKDVNTFYYTSDDKQLYLGDIKLSNADDLTAAIARIAVNEGHIGNVAELTTAAKASLVAAVNEIKAEIATLTGGEGAEGGITDIIKGVTGDLADLETENKGNLVAAINELVAKTNITIETTDATETEGKKYTVKQGTTTLGVIDIPKDMVVSSGEIVTLADGDVEGKDAGKYIKLTISTGEVLYIAVGDLVDLYKGSQDAGMENLQVKVTVNQDTRVIEAFLGANSVGSTELIDASVTTAKIADAAVETVKIKDGAVTEDKLSAELKSTITAGGNAVKDIQEGTNNGTIKVVTDPTDAEAGSKEVAIHGLKSAAFADSAAFEVAGAANTAETNAKTYVDTALTWGTIANADTETE